ncbi:MAG: hypothetical protein IPJ65_10570 [Archangiaceae bacterium]|nr:hypothetical protein [Archangiaceae bacterium]
MSRTALLTDVESCLETARSSRVREARRAGALGLVAAVALVGARVHAQEVPHQLALMVMLKVLTYDGNFALRGGADFVVLVPYAKGEAARAEETVTKAEAVDLHSINYRALKYVPVLVSELGSVKGSAVLLHPGASAEMAKEALAFAAKAKLYSLAFDEGWVKEGAVLGVAGNAGKPQVLINVTAARGIGADFKPAVLKVARTFQ